MEKGKELERKKRPRVTNTTFKYRTILQEETSKTFRKRLLHKINLNIVKNFGTEEAVRVMGLLNEGKITISNPELYLLSLKNISDNSLELYNTCNSFHEFYYKSLFRFKELAESGETNIEIKEFFLVLADILSKGSDLTPLGDICTLMKNLITTLSNVTHKSPFHLVLFDPSLFPFIEKATGLSTICYAKVIGAVLKACYELTTVEGSLPVEIAYPPKCDLVYPVYEDSRSNLEFYISSSTRSKIEDVRKVLRNVKCLYEDSPELRVALETLFVMNNPVYYNVESLILELKEKAVNNPFKLYPNIHELSDMLHVRKVSRAYVSNRVVQRCFINQELMEKTFKPYFSNINIDCSEIPVGIIDAYIDAAKTLSLIRVHNYKEITTRFRKEAKDAGKLFKITLLNVGELTKDFVQHIKKKTEQLKSLTGRDFYIEMYYSNSIIETRASKVEADYIRVISDIHADYNKQHNYSFCFGDDFIINCGDTGGDAQTCIDWHAQHVRNGVTVAGNHLGYSPMYPDLDGINNMETYGNITHPKNTKTYQMYQLGRALSGNSRARFMSNSVVEYRGIVILGTCLYTDFALYGDKHIEESMDYAKRYMNDFRYPTVLGHREYTRKGEDWDITMKKYEDSQVRLFTPQDHAYYFNYSLNFLKEKVVEYANKPIIIVTHHAPSPHSISEEFEGSMLNPAFASNLNEFIIKHPQIRLWCHGHCVDDQTEVLTTNGWKYFYQIRETDEVLNLNPTNNKIEKDRINAIISKEYTGDVYHFKSKGSDIRVTEDHDMLTIYRKTKKLTKIKAKDLYNKKQKFLVRAGIQEKSGVDLSDNLLRLLVWIAADGSRPKENLNLIRFHLFKERKIKRLQELLNSLNIQYRTYFYSDKGGCSINFDLPQELRGMSFKPIDPIISQCNQHQCSVVLEEYANTDGVHNENSIIIYTSKKEEADTIQLMCITNNYGCSIATRKGHGFKLQSEKPKVSYELNIVNKPYRCLDNPHRTTSIEHVTNEHFWCLNTNNGTLIIRRNGKVNFTGNCHSNFDYILGKTRVVCCPFGYNNENNVDLPYNYGKRILISDIKSKKDWTEICEEEINKHTIQVFDS